MTSGRATHNDIEDTTNSEVYLEITSVFVTEQVRLFDPVYKSCHQCDQ